MSQVTKSEPKEAPFSKKNTGGAMPLRPKSNLPTSAAARTSSRAPSRWTATRPVFSGSRRRKGLLLAPRASGSVFTWARSMSKPSPWCSRIWMPTACWISCSPGATGWAGSGTPGTRLSTSHPPPPPGSRSRLPQKAVKSLLGANTYCHHIIDMQLQSGIVFSLLWLFHLW